MWLQKKYKMTLSTVEEYLASFDKLCTFKKHLIWGKLCEIYQEIRIKTSNLIWILQIDFFKNYTLKNYLWLKGLYVCLKTNSVYFTLKKVYMFLILFNFLNLLFAFNEFLMFLLLKKMRLLILWNKLKINHNKVLFRKSVRFFFFFCSSFLKAWGKIPNFGMSYKNCRISFWVLKIWS